MGLLLLDRIVADCSSLCRQFAGTLLLQKGPGSSRKHYASV